MPWAEFHGAPVDDAGQPVDYQITAPDGLVLDETLRDEFVPIARELNLSQKGAEKLVALKAKDAQRQLENWGNHLNDLKTQAKADPTIGGANYDKSVTLARQTISKFGTPAFKKMLNDYGVGAHPEMIRYMANVAKATGETPSLPSGDGPGVVAKPLHDILYKDPQ